MADDSDSKAARRCPICKAPSVAAYQPFCSKRCADIDLGKWFNNSYAIPGAADAEDAASPANTEGDERGSDR